MLLILDCIILPIYPLTYVLHSCFFVPKFCFHRDEAGCGSRRPNTRMNTDTKFNEGTDLGCETIKRNFGHIFLD